VAKWRNVLDPGRLGGGGGTVKIPRDHRVRKKWSQVERGNTAGREGNARPSKW